MSAFSAPPMMSRGGMPRNKSGEPDGELNLKLLWRTLRYTRKYARTRNTLLVIVFLRALQIPLFGLGISWLLSGPIENYNYVLVVDGTLALFALAVFTQITFHYRMRLSQELGEAVVHDIRTDLFDKLQQLSMGYYDRTKLGRIISRMTSDAEAMRVGVQEVLFVSLVQAGHVIVAAAVMLWFDPVLFGVVLLMSPVLYGMTSYFRKRIGAAWQAVQESFSRVTSTLAEAVNGIRVTQGFVRQDVNSQSFSTLVSDHGEMNMRAMRLQAQFLPLLELNNQFFISMLLVLGGYQVLVADGSLLPFLERDQEAQFQALIVFFFMVNYFFGGIGFIGRMYNLALSAMAGAERVFTLLDTVPEQLDTPDATDLPVIHGRVAFEDVVFAYDKDRPVLHGINFQIDAGQTVALVGHTGSGKSTIIKLISKFYVPTGGRITIDDRDLTGVTTESLINQLGIVLQSNFLFTGSVMDNIRMGRPGSTDAQVVDAARKLGCLDLLEQLPDGLQTQVGEKGTSLSLGQRQLVCFCRAMLADPRILILDEATSSVDTMTEARIQQALSILLKGRTNFVVAHRLSTIRHADLVLVLDHGHVVERGTHNDLLAQGGTYASLYRQFIHATEA